MSPRFPQIQVRAVSVRFFLKTLIFMFDSRSILEEEETSIDQLEQKLDRILKMCGVMVDTGKTYVAQQRLVFVVNL